ncbi:hypothetical protein SPI_02499 [Niveomyces insectorum RCEF 264]|uniref:Tafazzin n=1 Tax=Niveomyces insectorum RCEF 264 TaxID=1081102 RepID=A0A162J9L3_9HYPO|nr:hypothetical protein SPI_02499 [Niveomyces insectorum RCEF 264]
MPKRRHWAQYSKPQTTAPHSLESSGRQSNVHHEEPQARSVNELLARLRNASFATSAAGAASASDGGGSSSGMASPAAGARLPSLSPVPMVSPSVPPEIAQILLPTPPPGFVGPAMLAAAPTAPGPVIHGAAGPPGGRGQGVGRRRLPPGPAPPPSWLAQSRHAPRRLPGVDQNQANEASRHADLRLLHQRIGMLEIASVPTPGSLVDVVLRKMVLSWDVQRHFNQHHLPYLQGGLKAALVSYLGGLGENGGGGVSIGDLRSLLLPTQTPSPVANDTADISNGESDDDGDSGAAFGASLPPSPSTLNEDFHYLDLTGSVGRSVSIKEVNDLLFPSRPPAAGPKDRGRGSSVVGDGGRPKTKDARNATYDTVLESWDAPDVVSPPRPLLPNLTHLSLALAPPTGGYGAPVPHASWRQLLAFAAHLPRLTHLSLAYWPEPTLTPNAKFATVVSPQGRRLQYGGTGPYSHSLDNDWAEAVLLVRRLSKALYGLEYLDLTGCAAWFPALMHRVDEGQQVDWVGDWGKVTTLVLRCGAGRPGLRTGVDGDEHEDDNENSLQPGDVVVRQVNAASEAKLIERHIRQQRAGQGRFITVVSDKKR